MFETATAVWEALYGNAAAARQKVATALALGRGRDVDYAAAFALAVSGDVSRSRALADDLARDYPEDTSVQFMYLPALRALFALDARDPAAAIQSLQTASRFDLALGGIGFNAYFGKLYPIYVRGLAYLAAQQPAEAAAEFQRIVDHRSIVLVDPIDAFARLQLARALALSGDTVKAKSAYNDLLTLWKNADAEIPVLERSTGGIRATAVSGAFLSEGQRSRANCWCCLAAMMRLRSDIQGAYTIVTRRGFRAGTYPEGVEMLRLSILIASAIVCTASSVFAQTEGRFSVGASVTLNSTTDADVGSTTTVGPLLRLNPHKGWGPAAALNWFRPDLRDPAGGTGDFAQLRVRPLMGGLSYTVGWDAVLTSFSIVGGPSFNKADSTAPMSRDRASRLALRTVLLSALASG